jgi:hypothetical protein
MKTHYAPAERAEAGEFEDQIDLVSKDPVVESLLQAAAGLIAVLNERRQVVAINDTFLRKLGIEDPRLALGLRHGEVLACVHSEDEPHGCGTTKFCETCGAAVAIVASLGEQRPMERTCAIATRRGGQEVDVALSVRSQPMTIRGQRFLLIFLQDVTQETQRAALERAFFHDIGNMINVLSGAAELLELQQPSKLATTIRHASTRLHRRWPSSSSWCSRRRAPTSPCGGRSPWARCGRSCKPSSPHIQPQTGRSLWSPKTTPRWPSTPTSRC